MNGRTIKGDIITLDSSTFTMYGGIISGDHFQTEDNSALTIHGGRIEGNINTANAATFTRNGSTLNG